MIQQRDYKDIQTCFFLGKRKLFLSISFFILLNDILDISLCDKLVLFLLFNKIKRSTDSERAREKLLIEYESFVGIRNKIL